MLSRLLPQSRHDFRGAYLELLKRSLCDLLSPQTFSAVPQDDGTVVAEPLDGGLLDRRLDGRDWPLNGTTMVGMQRLNAVQRCIEQIARDRVPGDVIETGVWRGGTSIFMRAAMRANGLADRDVWLADSFQGLPAPDKERYPADVRPEQWANLDKFDFLAVSQEEVRAAFERHGLLDERVRFLPGWFSETLPTMRGRQWSLLRLDGDMYESTIVALENLYDGLSVGGFVMVDDYGAIPPCKQAVDDFRAERGIDDEIHTVDWTGAWWRRSR